jgi:hypothetical protein
VGSDLSGFEREEREDSMHVDSTPREVLKLRIKPTILE